MKTINFLNKSLFILSFLLTYTAIGQTISGKVVDADGNTLPFVNVMEKGTTNGTTTDDNGAFSLKVEKIPTVILVSFIGFITTEKKITSKAHIIIKIIEESVGLDEVVVTGNRAKPRTILDSPVPIDNISVKELKNSGKTSLDGMLTFKVPSFNSQNQAITDATAHYDPADLRGLGPSRTLVLINGKRKNQSAQIYLNRTPGKGEVGTDLKSIPTAAIANIEVLRDGASAQYGSDAIAGVMNIILKKKVEFSTITSKSGITSEGDGFNFTTDFNTSFNFGKGGFINLTLAYYKQNITNRAGSPGIEDLPKDARPNEIAWAKENPKLGMIVGNPEMRKGDLFINMEHPLGKKATLYLTHGFTIRTGKSFAYYRAPYWRRDVADAQFLSKTEDFTGYHPTFEAEIEDNFNTVGIRFDLGKGNNLDISTTYGRNIVDYTMNNSLNRDYLKLKGTSPTTFKPGGYSLQNIIGNIDYSKSFDKLAISVGTEFKQERFKSFEGDPFSYFGSGSDSFPGMKPSEVFNVTRKNYAFYTGVDYDITEKLLIGLDGRYEDFTYSGSNFSWKIDGRYKLGDKGAIRASYGTGFRAPTLHQRFLVNTQFVVFQGLSEPQRQGNLANDDPAIRGLGVPKLTHELSKNIAAGITYKFNRNFSASLDFYQIKVDNRVLFSSQIGKDSDDTKINPIEQILKDNGVSAVQFFINAGDTKTTGADFVLNYRNIKVGDGKFHISMASNFNKTIIDAITTPKTLLENGYNIFDRQERALITNSRPKSKVILGINYVNEKWDISFNNTRFGEVIVTAPESGGIDQTLSSKTATDIAFSYKLTDKINFNANVNNIFDVYPDLTLKSTKTENAGTRFKYSYEVQQLGQLGTNFSVGFNFQF